LESLAAKHGAAEEELITKPEERLEAPPEWIVEEAGAEELEATPTPAEELPDWLSEMAEPAPEEEAPAELAVSLPEWPAEEPAATVEAATEELEAAPTPAEELPDWLSEMAEPAPPVELPADEAPTPVAAPPPTAPDLGDEDAALAWLESLAAKHGAAEEELITKPEERLEAPPEWVVEEAEAPPLPAGAEDLPEWLAEVPAAVETAPEELEAAPTPAEELPDWLSEMAEPPPEKEEAPAEPVAGLSERLAEEPATVEAATEELEAAPTPAEELPDWSAETSIEPEARPEEGIPDWMKDTAISKAAPEIPIIEEISEITAPAEPEPAEIQPSPTISSEQPSAELLDINTASLSQLEALPGIGFVLAQSIIAYRDTYGLFATVDDLEKISGIGPGIVSEIRHLIASKAPDEKRLPRTAPLPADEAEAEFVLARSAITEGDGGLAAKHYSRLVKKGTQLDQVIADLQEALYRFPVDINIWQTLGDAYLRSNKLKDALEAYIKAEELLR
ncbi:MAG: helix-hairpin-helix domain-containing protein, partial [Anaerolineales bacterium]|nr:helix-hairpin-helix domain-containing protein [Anaerolineales bacterium]